MIATGQITTPKAAVPGAQRPLTANKPPVPQQPLVTGKPPPAPNMAVRRQAAARVVG